MGNTDMIAALAAMACLLALASIAMPRRYALAPALASIALLLLAWFLAP